MNTHEIIVIVLLLLIIAGIVINYNAGIKLGTNLIMLGLIGIIIGTLWNNYKKNKEAESNQQSNQPTQ